MTELSVDTIHEMRGSGIITESGVNKPTYVEVDTFDGFMGLTAGAYHVDIAEEVEVPEGSAGVIGSLESVSSVGALIVPRRVGSGVHDDLQITLICLRSVEIEPGSSIAKVSIEDNLTKANVESYIEDKMQSLSEYLEYGSVEETP